MGASSFSNPILTAFEVRTDAKLVECLLSEGCPILGVNWMVWLVDLKKFEPVGESSDSSLAACDESMMSNGLSTISFLNINTS